MNDVIIYFKLGLRAPRNALAVIHSAKIEPTIVAKNDSEGIIDSEGKRV